MAVQMGARKNVETVDDAPELRAKRQQLRHALRSLRAYNPDFRLTPEVFRWLGLVWLGLAWFGGVY